MSYSVYKQAQDIANRLLKGEKIPEVNRIVRGLAVKMYADRLKDVGKTPKEIYTVLTDKLGYNYKSAKGVLADIFLDLE